MGGAKPMTANCYSFEVIFNTKGTVPLPPSLCNTQYFVWRYIAVTLLASSILTHWQYSHPPTLSPHILVYSPYLYIIWGSHFSQSEEAEIGGILPEVGGKPLHIMQLFEKYWRKNEIKNIQNPVSVLMTFLLFTLSSNTVKLHTRKEATLKAKWWNPLRQYTGGGKQTPSLLRPPPPLHLSARPGRPECLTPAHLLRPTPTSKGPTGGILCIRLDPSWSIPAG